MNESFGERALDKLHHRAGSGGGDLQSQQQQQNTQQGGVAVTSGIQRDGNVISANDKAAGSQLNVHSRRDASYMNDLMRSRAIFKCVPVHYREKPGSVVALASFPGSGNTWLRYLLQLSTGIHWKIKRKLKNIGHACFGGQVLIG